jgi:DNA-binding CsgD family transcriptional regulator
VGFGPVEIARILGTTANTVNVTLHNIRKSRSAKRRGSAKPNKES